MTLPVGSKLASYQILGPLGAGAMGEVYRARDTKLDREVAIKVLPEHFATDEERLRRFEREAKTLATLNHPNVAQIFGVDQVGDTCFLVLELVPGESLEERLKRGPLPVDESIDVCRQIAEGLEAAHEAGVIHRDLKPANVRITPEGKVKVLDFGLAKPAQVGKPGSSTDSVLSTEAGRLLGTPTYMAPEQARGKSIDKRVDVWAFGCVLYECLTAKRAFAGETLTDVLGSVLHTQPDLALLPPATQPRVRALIAACLEKDPRQRLRDVGDARRELERREVEPVAARPRSAGLAWLVVLVAAGAAAGAYLLGRAGGADVPEVHRTQLELSLAPADQLGPSSRSRPFRPAFAITSDGRRIVFVGETKVEGADDPMTRLYLRPLDAAAATAIPGTEGANSVFLSPDDRWAGFLADGEIKKAPLDGGPVERVARLVDGGLPSSSPLVRADSDFFGGCFDADGSILFGRYGDGLWEVPPRGGAPKRLTQPAAQDSHRLPHLLPGGRGILFTEHNVMHPRVCLVPRRGGEVRVLVEEASDARFVAPGRILFARDGTLMAAPFDLERLEVTGPATALASNLLHAYDGERPAVAVLTGFFDVSATGTLVFAEGGRNPFAPGRLVWVGRDGKAEPLASSPEGYYARPSLSPDGKRVAVSFAAIGQRVMDARVTLIDLERGTTARIVDEEGWWGPLWSADGARVFTGTRRDGVFRLAPDGSEPPFRLPRSREGMVSSVSEDGRYLFQTAAVEGNGTDVLRLDLQSEAEAEPWIHTRANEAWPEISPDGGLLAFGSDATGRFEVYVQPYPGPGPRRQVSIDGGSSPMWSHAGDELFFTQPASKRSWNRYLVASVGRDGERAIGRPQLLFEGVFGTLGGVTGYDLTPDDQRFLMVDRSDFEGTPVERLRVVQGWLPEMKSLPSSSAP